MPETTAGICITIVWLPLNILFTAIYMGSIARWYLNFSARNISRIKSKLNKEAVAGRAIDRSFLGTLRRHFRNTTAVARKHPAGGRKHGSAPTASTSLIHHPDDNDDTDVSETSSSYSLYSDFFRSESRTKLHPDDDSVELPPYGRDAGAGAPTTRGPQRQAVADENENAITLTTMKDLIGAVHETMESSATAMSGDREWTRNGPPADLMLRYLSLPTNHENGQAGGDQPSLALRVLVQERLAHIVAYEICGNAHHVDVKDAYIVFRIGQWRPVLKKWSLPSGSWKAFRAAALQAMILVGEKSLLRDGPKALFELSPDDFHGMFSPVVAAMGAASTLYGWLRSTEELARQFVRDVGNDNPSGRDEGPDPRTPPPPRLPQRLIVEGDSIRAHRITRNPFPIEKCLTS